MSIYDPDPRRRGIPSRIRRYPGLVAAWRARRYGRRTTRAAPRRTYRRRARYAPDPQYVPTRRFARARAGARRVGWAWPLGFLAAIAAGIGMDWKALQTKFQDAKNYRLKIGAYIKTLTGISIDEASKTVAAPIGTQLPFWAGIALVILRYIPIRGLIPRRGLLARIGTGLIVGSAIAAIPVAMETSKSPWSNHKTSGTNTTATLPNIGGMM